MRERERDKREREKEIKEREKEIKYREKEIKEKEEIKKKNIYESRKKKTGNNDKIKKGEKFVL
mgnify:CR=1 FL=1